MRLASRNYLLQQRQGKQMLKAVVVLIVFIIDLYICVLVMCDSIYMLV
jgi:hypothetical protein